MTEGAQVAMPATAHSRKRKGQKPAGKGKKRMKPFPGMGKKGKVDLKTKKLYRRRARDYNSDEEDDESAPGARDENMKGERDEVKFGGDFGDSDGDEDNDMAELNEGTDDEDAEMEQGAMKFLDGIRAFRVAFHAIMDPRKEEEELGPMLSKNKKLVVAKLAEEVAERKAKGTAKKEKRMLEEKGHVKPANYIDAHEKFLIGVATKGVVKLFNAVNKAQAARRSSVSSRSKDAKALRDRRKQAFLSELKKTSTHASNKASGSTSQQDKEEPAWAPLRDSYMLTNPKLKDWDKMTDKAAEDLGMQADSSDDDDSDD